MKASLLTVAGLLFGPLCATIALAQDGGAPVPRTPTAESVQEAAEADGKPVAPEEVAAGEEQSGVSEAAADSGDGGEAPRAPAGDEPGPTPVDADAGKSQPGPEPSVEKEEEPKFQKYTWDPRSGYGLCDLICAQDEACVDGRCLARCSPECRDGTYCTAAGECLPLPSAHADVQTEAELQTRFGKASADAHHAAFIDIAGILFRGAGLNYEWGSRHAGRVRFAPMNTGLMNYFEEPGTEFERFEWGLSGAVGYRHYEAKFGNLRGFYYGGGAQYSFTEIRDLVEGLYILRSHFVGAFGEFGYRWAFDHFLFGFGPSLGFRYPIYQSAHSLGSGSCIYDSTCPERGGFGVLEGVMGIELGWFP